jgi:hypothetical protein
MTTSRWVLLAILAAIAAREAYLDSRAGRSHGETTVERLFAQRRSDRMVEVEGRVSNILPDDRQGSQHQRFIVTLASGHTLLVAHNIDLAPRVPLREGETIAVKGEYEWNDKGGVLHWTHRDPDGRHEGGWIRYAGEIYR